MSRFVVTGTDTDVGKTVFAAALAAHLGAHYWKPIQAGTGDGTDSARVAELSGWRAAVLPEAYVLKTPCSPHEAARIDGVMIAPDRLALPAEDGPLVVEGAGGVLVPITGDLLYADLFARWGLPVILVELITEISLPHRRLLSSKLGSKASRNLGATQNSLQKFASVHASLHNHFASERHLVDRQTFKLQRSAALAEWQSLGA